jgi:hypothetical protein
MRPAAQGASSDSESEPDHPHDEEDEDNNVIYTAKQQQQQQQPQQQPGHGATTAPSFRSRILPRHHSKGITTAPGQHGAGETETEADEPVRIRHCLQFSLIEKKNLTRFFFHYYSYYHQPKHLPTARIVPVSGPLVPPNTLEQVITPLLFEASRLLSIVPAVFGVLYNLFNAWYAPINGNVAPIDYAVSALWVRHF